MGDYIEVSVSLCFCLLACLKSRRSKLHQNFLYVTYGRGPVLHWR